MKLGWTPEALADLTHIRCVIARTRPVAANKVVRHIKASTRLLLEQPRLGREGRIPGTREWLVTGSPYVVSCLVREDVILILRIIHTSIDWRA